MNPITSFILPPDTPSIEVTDAEESERAECTGRVQTD